MKNGYVGIESNKPDCAENFSKLNTDKRISVETLQVKYPQGAEKQLISAVLNRAVPPGVRCRRGLW